MAVSVVLLAAACGGSTTGASSSTTLAPLGCGTASTFTYETIPGVDPNLTSLDVYTPPAVDGSCTGRPLVVWVHGGGWAGGDKSEFMEYKIPLFAGAGFVFASVNYRLTDTALTPPSPQYPVHDDDTAASIAWLIDNAAALGVDPSHVAVLGHSAGGGITAAVTTDDRYLGAHGVELDAVSCAASMDGEGYDITAGATASPPEWQPTYTNAFGTDPVGLGRGLAHHPRGRRQRASPTTSSPPAASTGASTSTSRSSPRSVRRGSR